MPRFIGRIASDANHPVSTGWWDVYEITSADLPFYESSYPRIDVGQWYRGFKTTPFLLYGVEGPGADEWRVELGDLIGPDDRPRVERQPLIGA